MIPTKARYYQASRDSARRKPLGSSYKLVRVSQTCEGQTRSRFPSSHSQTARKCWTNASHHPRQCRPPCDGDLAAKVPRCSVPESVPRANLKSRRVLKTVSPAATENQARESIDGQLC